MENCRKVRKIKLTLENGRFRRIFKKSKKLVENSQKIQIKGRKFDKKQIQSLKLSIFPW